MKYGIHRKAVGVGAVLSLGLAGLLVFSLPVPVQLRKDASELDPVHEVPMQTQRIYIMLLDLETSQRGYLLTQATPYPEPCRAGLARQGPELERLSVLMADQPAPGRRHTETAP